MLLNTTPISAFNCFPMNTTCELFSNALASGSFSLMNNLLSLFYIFPSLIYGITSTTGYNTQSMRVYQSTGHYYTYEPPEYAFDQIIGNKYTNYGHCNYTIGFVWCGENTGVYLTLQCGTSLLLAFQLDVPYSIPERDPLTITIEGSNQSISALMLGSSWTLIYNGSTGFNPDPGRNNSGIIQNMSNNTSWYTSYRILVTSKRHISDAVHFGEIELLGY
jgi:hypothetical protein